MKALTLRHPWPFAICHLGKRIENRPRAWRCLIGQRFAIHGGAEPRGKHWSLHCQQCEELVDRFGIPVGFDSFSRTALGAALQHIVDRNLDELRKVLTPRVMVMEGIVATAICHEIVTESDDPWFEGPNGIVLRDVIVLPTPIPCKGAQGLWTVPADVLAQIESEAV